MTAMTTAVSFTEAGSHTAHVMPSVPRRMPAMHSTHMNPWLFVDSTHLLSAPHMPFEMQGTKRATVWPALGLVVLPTVE